MKMILRQKRNDDIHSPLSYRYHHSDSGYHYLFPLSISKYGSFCVVGRFTHSFNFGMKSHFSSRKERDRLL